MATKTRAGDEGQQGKLASTRRSPATLPWLALLSFALGLGFSRVGLADYSHWLHPVGLRGASGMPHALVFNLLLFVAPGALLVATAQRFAGSLRGAGWLARIGIVLAQLSALAFLAQGVLPLDPADMDAPASRLHVLAWMLWWIAFAPGALLLSLGAQRGRAFALASLAAALLVPWVAVFAPLGAWVGIAQRVAFGLWFGWWLFAAVAISRVSVSGPGSLPTAGR